MSYKPIENYAVIGDLHTVALVCKNASIDFMCFPHIDSPSIFARMLDYEKGGYFQIRPLLENYTEKQIYLSDTNILLTRFLSPNGVAEVSDFMPVEITSPHHELVRRVKTVSGDMDFEMVCKPAFDYARAGHKIEREEGAVRFIPEGEHNPVLRLYCEVPDEIEDGAVIARFHLSEGETAAFILEDVVEGKVSPARNPGFVREAFKDTVNYWHDWIENSSYNGRWREEVNRSALVLKLLTSQLHGSIAAAATFSLPEIIGGVRNWDYRYAWIRDASFTLYGLIRLGLTEEANKFMHWIDERAHELEPDGSLQVMYRLNGNHEMPEQELDHLEGYRCSQPVRIGNDAYKQLQLDIYGELMDSVYLANKYGEPISNSLWQNLVRLLNWLCENWQQPDEGIWEVRGGKQHFLHSRLMSWVALDRGLRLAAKRSFPAPIDRWQKERDTIYHDIHENFWDPELEAFVQSLGSKYLDASSLLMPLVRFISPTDPRWLKHLKAVERTLVFDSFVYRYNVGESAPDGLIGEEGTFSICTFWYVECLSRAGELEKARFYFEKMLGYANHVGLFAEELGTCGEHLGNTPQAFTHLALISAAYDINRRLDG
ncbi:MAG: glycoside hydrolase family 15 protein [Anaerolineales bacterium]|jgi:GH15 family glucan-1,4-alpha-glucosidase